MLDTVKNVWNSKEAGIQGHLPIQGSDVAVKWDHLYDFLIGLSAFFFILVVGLMIFFAIKYKKGNREKSKYVDSHVPLEIFWTAVPTVLLMVIFFWGFFVYKDMRTIPHNAMEVRVLGKQWLWQFTYDNGRTEIGNLFVPVNQPIKLVMTSQDVIHSFFIPNFRTKQDVVPGLYTTLWFQANIPGRHTVYCAEYCGGTHSGMLAQVIALTPEEWDQFQKGRKFEVPKPGVSGDILLASANAAEGSFSGKPLTEQGKELFEGKGTCVTCHSIDGSKKIGPSLKGVFGSERTFADGSTATADENYIRESIEMPNTKVIQGFAPVMPTWKGILSDQEITALVKYIETLK